MSAPAQTRRGIWVVHGITPRRAEFALARRLVFGNRLQARSLQCLILYARALALVGEYSADDQREILDYYGERELRELSDAQLLDLIDWLEEEDGPLI
jgi:hypothetical protein